MLSVYQDMGRPKASAKTYSIAALGQMVRLGYNNRARDLYYQNLKLGKGPEYYFYSGLLSFQVFDLSDPNSRGVRSVDLSKVDIFRLPKNDNFTNFYPVGECGTGLDNFEITQVSPGEENFYTGPDFSNFRFCVLKAMRMDFFNVPGCVNKIEIESTFDNKKDEEIDIPMDIAFDICFQILGWEIKFKQISHVKSNDNNYQPEALELRRRLEEQANKTV